MSTAIKIQSIVKSFGAGPPAVGGPDGRGINLDIQPGELFFLLGPSGCGKTTLLRMIAGFTEPTSGSIVFLTANGQQRDVTHEPPNKRNTGMVFQSYALWPHMTVAQNVAFGLEVRKIGAEEIRRRVAEALDIVQMGQYAQRKPNQLSGGQQQRIALARALVVRPDVLLLDEPLSNLDAKLRVELRGEIRRICKTAGGGGITTVYVTHDQKEALSMADRVAIMSAGSVVQLGSPEELYRRPATRFVAEFLGETNFLPVQRVEDSRVTTPAGTLASARVSVVGASSGAGVAGAAELLVSLRPEALRLGSPENAPLKGTIIERTYLGELAQLLIELKPAAGGGGPGSGTGGGGAGGGADAMAALRKPVKVALLNPGASPSGSLGVGAVVGLSADPDDVVLVTAASGATART